MGAWRNGAATRGVPRPRSVPSGGVPRPRFSSSPPLSGQSGVPLRGAYFSAGASGASLRAGCFAPAFVGLGVGFSLVVSPAGSRLPLVACRCGRHSRRSPTLQPSARCVLSTFVRARVSAPFALAPTCVNSKSSFKIYRAILYRTIDDFDYDFKLTNARRLLSSSGCSAPLPHPPP